MLFRILQVPLPNSNELPPSLVSNNPEENSAACWMSLIVQRFWKTESNDTKNMSSGSSFLGDSATIRLETAESKQ